nr:DNA repair protein RecO [Membranihabitans marinus]
MTQAQCIVLRRMNYRESSMIIDVFSQQHGMVACIVSGVRKKGSKLSPVLFTPGYLLDMVYYESDPHKLWRIKEVTLASHLQRTPYDILRGNTALCMCEVLKKVLPVYDVNPSMFDFIESYIYLLDEVEKPANVLLHFLIQLSVQLGFGPHHLEDNGKSYFDLKSGSFLPHSPGHPMYIDQSLTPLFYDLIRVEAENLESVKLSRVQRQQLTDHVIDYIRFHSHAFERIKSYDVLKSLW